MLTDLDAVLFPDDCEVVEIPLHDRHIYLIQKNGSSSLRSEALAQGWQIIRNNDLLSLDSVDIYLRDPMERYISGVNTFVHHLIRDDPSLDRHTCETFAIRYNFLNRHYIPQWHWVVNIARFLHADCKIRLHGVEDLTKITDRRSRAGIQPLNRQRTTELISSSTKLELWHLLDHILLGYCGQSLTWKQILRIYQDHPACPLQLVQHRMESVQRVLS